MPSLLVLVYRAMSLVSNLYSLPRQNIVLITVNAHFAHFHFNLVHYTVVLWTTAAVREHAVPTPRSAGQARTVHIYNAINLGCTNLASKRACIHR